MGLVFGDFKLSNLTPIFKNEKNQTSKTIDADASIDVNLDVNQKLDVNGVKAPKINYSRQNSRTPRKAQLNYSKHGFRRYHPCLRI